MTQAREEKTMKNTAILMLAGAVIVVSGCSKQDPNKREAGKWQNSIEVESLKLSGVPTAMQAQAAQMEGQMKQQLTGQMKAMNVEECLSGDAAAKENIGDDITKGMSGGGKCTFAKNAVADGKLNVDGTCNMMGQSMKVTVTGTVTPKQVDAVMALSAAPSGSGMMMKPGMDLKMKISQKHLGSCS
jgi:Protein of unknown function (DUF3617)